MQIFNAPKTYAHMDYALWHVLIVLELNRGVELKDNVLGSSGVADLILKRRAEKIDGARLKPKIYLLSVTDID